MTSRCTLSPMWTGKEHTRNRLDVDKVAWLTTVSESGRPSTAPVWFLVEDDMTIIVYSRDPSVRVRNLAANSAVTLALNSDPKGHDIVVLNGDAVVDPSVPGAAENAAFIDKYRSDLEAYEWTPEWFASNYPAPIRITPTAIRGR